MPSDRRINEFLSGHDPVTETFAAAYMAAIGPEPGEAFLATFLGNARFSHPDSLRAYCRRVREQAAFLRSQ